MPELYFGYSQIATGIMFFRGRMKKLKAQYPCTNGPTMDQYFATAFCPFFQKIEKPSRVTVFPVQKTLQKVMKITRFELL